MTTILRYIKYPIRFVLLGAALTGCFQSDYTKLVKQELARGTRQDSVLLGIYFGDTQNEFHGKCFDLNKNRLVTQGPGNSSIQYIFTDSSVHAQPTQITLILYPGYDKSDKITDFNLELSYTGWAPWNRKFQSDSLKAKVIELLMRWYKGNEFVTAQIKGAEVPVKVDANRRILVYVKDTKSVIVKIQDILHPRFMHSISKDK